MTDETASFVACDWLDGLHIRTFNKHMIKKKPFYLSH